MGAPLLHGEAGLTWENGERLQPLGFLRQEAVESGKARGWCAKWGELKAKCGCARSSPR